MTTPNIEELRKLAEAASNGDWENIAPDESGRYNGHYITAHYGTVCDLYWMDGKKRNDHRNADNNAAFIAAANPERVLELLDALQSQAERIKALAALSVTNILLEVVPGEDGGGHEVYAKSVDAVVDVLTRLGTQLEDAQCERDTLRAQLAAIAATEPVAWINYKVIVKDGEAVGHESASVSFVRQSYGYDWSKSAPLFTRPMPAQDVNAELVEALNNSCGVLEAFKFQSQTAAFQLEENSTALANVKTAQVHPAGDLCEYCGKAPPGCNTEFESEKACVFHYPGGDVAGPCICGSWPGGNCLKCPRIKAGRAANAKGAK